MIDRVRLCRARGKKLTVFVGGAPYPAVLDSRKILRFRKNEAVDHIVVAGNCALNKLAWAFAEGLIPLKDYAELNMMIGYSVDGFCDLQAFRSLEVKTPDWIREGKTPWRNKK